ncbi:uncharacterized protein [Montipora foliosa]|uniref:uncharacterized protein n=1 Tax=Montipora foliosa TaxID=591990 RepID=UPI0035F1B93E
MTRFSRQQSYVSLTALEMILLTGVLSFLDIAQGNPAIELNPNLFIVTRLGMTWKEFCSKLEHSLKQRVGWSLYDKNGTGVSPDRIIFMNVKTNCDDPSKKNEQTEVWFYVSKSGSKELDEWLTLKAYRVLQMLLENGNAKQLGPEFEGKVIHVDLAGESSSKHKSLFDSGKLSTLAIILIAIAGAVGLVLLIVTCRCVYCHGAKRRKKAKGEDSQALHVVHVATNSFTDGITEKRQEEEKKENSLDHTCTGDESKTNSENKKAENDNLGDNVQENERVISYENHAGHVPEKDDGEQNSNNEQACVVAPTIVTSPAPAEYENMDAIMNVNTVGRFPDTASSGSGGSRRGSGQGRGSKPPSPAALQRINADPGRRRSSAHSVIDDEDVPLTHKTGTVGIVALALRNKNERKKEAEFKNLSKDVPEEEVKYPENTQNKNRSPDVLPAPKTRVKLSSDPDYINANWIRDHKGQRRYIATQHPLQETAEDFWRMVWESRVLV